MQLRARILYDNLAVTPRRFGLSVLPHVLDLSSPLAKDGKTPLEVAIPIGKVLKSVTVQRVMQEWGVGGRPEAGGEGAWQEGAGEGEADVHVCSLNNSPGFRLTI